MKKIKRWFLRFKYILTLCLPKEDYLGDNMPFTLIDSLKRA